MQLFWLMVLRFSRSWLKVVRLLLLLVLLFGNLVPLILTIMLLLLLYRLLLWNLALHRLMNSWLGLL